MRRLGRGAIIVAALLLVVSVPNWAAWAATSHSRAREMGDSIGSMWLDWLPLVAALGLAAALVVRSGRLAELWFDDTEVGLDLGPRELLQLSIVVVGLGLVINGVLGTLAAAVSVGIQYATYRTAGDRIFGVVLAALVPVASQIAGVVIGILLMRFAEPLARKLWIEPKPVIAMPGPDPAALSLPKCPACGAPYDEADYVDMAVARCTTCHSPLLPTGE